MPEFSYPSCCQPVRTPPSTAGSPATGSPRRQASGRYFLEVAPDALTLLA